jgi:hypothetical protein
MDPLEKNTDKGNKQREVPADFDLYTKFLQT